MQPFNRTLKAIRHCENISQINRIVSSHPFTKKHLKEMIFKVADERIKELKNDPKT